jgi:hypothetical protein
VCVCGLVHIKIAIAERVKIKNTHRMLRYLDIKIK